LTKVELSPEYEEYNDTSYAKEDGRLDGGSLPECTPVTAITDIFARNLSASILEVTEEQLDQINEVANAWYLYTIEAGTYPRQEEDIQTIAQPNVLVATPDMDADFVYDLTKILYENKEFMI